MDHTADSRLLAQRTSSSEKVGLAAGCGSFSKKLRSSRISSSTNEFRLKKVVFEDSRERSGIEVFTFMISGLGGLRSESEVSLVDSESDEEKIISCLRGELAIVAGEDRENMGLGKLLSL